MDDSNCGYLYSDLNMIKMADLLVKQWGGLKAVQRTKFAFCSSLQVKRLLTFVSDRVKFLEAPKQ